MKLLRYSVKKEIEYLVLMRIGRWGLWRENSRESFFRKVIDIICVGFERRGGVGR